MTTLVKSENRDLRDLAKSANASKFWSRVGGEEGLFSIMKFAQELGLSPMLALSGGIHNIDGKVEISARAWNILIRKAGHTMKIKHLNNESCVVWGKRKDTGEELEVSWTIDDAKLAGLLRPGSPWIKYPKNMLFSRAISDLGKWLFTDCVGTAYIEGEIKDPVETIELPPMEEFKEEEVVFPIPECEDAAKVNLYFEESAKNYKGKYTVADLQKMALKNPDGFWKVYHEWQGRQ